MLIKKIGKRYKLKNSQDPEISLILNGKPVHQYEIFSGKMIQRYCNAGRAMYFTGIKDCNISRCCKNEGGYGSKSAGGYMWSYNKYDLYPINYKKNKAGKSVIQYTKDMTFLKEYINAREAEKETGTPYKSISNCCTFKVKTAKGYIWRFK